MCSNSSGVSSGALKKHSARRVPVGVTTHTSSLSFLETMTSDFSVVLFRPNFMLASEGYPMKAHKNQRLLTLPSSPNLPCGATNQGTYHDVWWADAFAVT